MKLAFVLFTYFPYGGLQRDFLRIVNACKEREIQISIFCMQWQGELIDEINIESPPLSGWTRTEKRNKFCQFWQEETKNKFDLIIGFNKMPGLDYYYAADSCFKKQAVEERTWLYRLTARCRQYIRFEESVFGNRSKTNVLFISPRQKQQYLEYYSTNSSRVFELKPGIDKGRMASAESIKHREDVRSKFSIKEDTMLVLQVGSGFSIKGVDRSIRAIASLPEKLKQKTHYFLVGQGKPGKYLKLAKKLGLAENVTILTGSDDIPRLLQGADMLLHPAYQESAGIILLEAVVAGLPVLTTDSCGFAFHVEKAGAGLVCSSPFKQEQLNKLLVEFYTKEKRKFWKNNGIEYGKNEDLYSMPTKVAELLVNYSRKNKS